ncbi:MAG: helix-turn-helix domain-containing protein [Ruminococcaceae bacterium]|nr:helix-turn-helix domain-containing protein [Oscillospiraceae bacterium]
MYSNLYDLILALEHGTKLHIGVIFFGYGRSERLMLPSSAVTHTSPFCRYRKDTLLLIKSCSECKRRALDKAVRLARPYGGYCVGGVYEYLHPVMVDGKAVAVIFVGNMLRGERGISAVSSYCDNPREMLESMDQLTSDEECERIASVIDSYIRMILELCPDEALKPDTPAVIKDIVSYVEGNLAVNIGLSSLAEIFHYNEKYLGRLFKSVMGKSLSLYICERRIEEAARLLRKTDLSVTEISLRTGFGNVTYFNRRFLQLMGVTPTRYRTQNSQKKE